MRSEEIFIRRTYGGFLTLTILALLWTVFSFFLQYAIDGIFFGKEALAVMIILSSFTFLLLCRQEVNTILALSLMLTARG